jgi:hypothetical protein
MSAPGKASTIKSVEVRLKLRSSVRLTPVCCGVTSSSARFEAASPYLIVRKVLYVVFQSVALQPQRSRDQQECDG